MLCLLSLPAALVAQLPSGNVEADRDFHLKFFTGLALTSDSDLRIVQPGRGNDLTFEGVSWDDRSLTGPSVPYVAVRLGFYLKQRPWLGFSADVMHFKVFAEVNDELRVRGQRVGQPIDQVQPMRRIVQQYDIANGINMLLLNVVGRWRFGESRETGRDLYELYVGAGAGPSFPYNQSRVDGDLRPGSYDSGRVGSQLFVGWQFNMRRHLDAFFEFKRTRVEADGPIAFGTSEATIDSDHYVFGFGYHL